MREFLQSADGWPEWAKALGAFALVVVMIVTFTSGILLLENPAAVWRWLTNKRSEQSIAEWDCNGE